jgi:adenosylcobinamide amidohydrolase
MLRVEQDALILSFSRPARILSWANLNGGFCHANHIINQQVHKNDAAFAADPTAWLNSAVHRLGLQGKVVGMMTAVKMESLEQASFSSGEMEATCFATVGLSNALTAGDKADATSNGETVTSHTINMILLVRPGLSHGAMVEAIQIATEGRVRALHEARILSTRSSLPATGTGTDCIAVVSLDEVETAYCGKHTKIGELIGLAAYTAVKKGLARGSATSGN